jgi:predicted metal-binding membrane protein
MGAMAEAPDPRASNLDALQVVLIATLFALAAGAWALTGRTMQGMDMGPGTDLGSLSFYVGAWVVMMSAMMFPSISPMVRTYALVQRSRYARRGLGRPTAAVVAFVAGYLLTWTIFGLAAFATFDLLRSLHLEAFSWDQGGPYLAGGVILAAAAYQLTPLKVLLGLEHGGWCVGCCWALMAALFALGVMSVAWMVFIAALIAVEKLLPWKRSAHRAIALVLAVLGIAVAFTPGSVPGLTLPDQASSSQGQGPAMDGGMS